MNSYIKNNGVNNKLSYDEKSFEFIGLNIEGNDNLINLEKTSKKTNRTCTINIKGNFNRIIMKENVVLKGTSILVIGDNNSLFIGSNTTFEPKCEIICSSGKAVQIGDDCLFSHNTSISTSDVYTLYDIKTKQIINPPNNVMIENHVWVCEECEIHKGSKILANSVVGAFTIVNKTYHKKNILICGQPAKIIKNDINWDRELTSKKEV